MTIFEGIEPYDSNYTALYCMYDVEWKMKNVDIIEKLNLTPTNDNGNVKRVIRCSTYTRIFSFLAHETHEK